MTTETPWLTRSEAAIYLSLSPKTLAGWTSEGRGPRCRKLGTTRPCAVRYSKVDLDRWIETARSRHKPSRVGS